MADNHWKLLTLDVDNTLFDWVSYYTTAFSALLAKVSELTDIPAPLLAVEAKEVFSRHGSIEYPFLVQELPSVNARYGTRVDKMLRDVVEPGRQAFLAAAVDQLVPYNGVKETLDEIRAVCPKLPIIALTDAPRYVAMWKMNKLGLLSQFDAIYGLSDPRIPTCEKTRRVKVAPSILLKHLQQPNFGFSGRIRILPEDYEKPGTKGLKTVLIDYDLDEDDRLRSRVLWVGDNQRKDIPLGTRMRVKTAWAKYGAVVSEEAYACLASFSPEQNIHKNANIASENAIQPDYTLEHFADLFALVKGE